MVLEIMTDEILRKPSTMSIYRQTAVLSNRSTQLLYSSNRHSTWYTDTIMLVHSRNLEPLCKSRQVSPGSPNYNIVTKTTNKIINR